ncbi:MAG: FxsA family protein [Bacteroidota bacterium]
MSLFGRLFLLFLIVPVVDLALLVSIGGRIGFWPTVGTVVLTALVGSWLARREGTAAWRRVQQKLATGGLPGPELIDGLVILVSGTLLLTPGFLTDLVGILGLLPPSRAVARKALRQRFERAVENGSVRVVGAPPFGGPPFGASPFGPPHQTVEDAEVIDDGAPPR